MMPSPLAESIGMADLRYAVILEPDDGAFSVIVPALPEVHTFGDTPDAALHIAREAIELCLEYRRDNGLVIPPAACARFAACGFKIDRQRGSHVILRHDDGRFVSVPMHAGSDVPRGLLASILDAAGLTPEELRDLL